MNCVILQPSYIPWRGYFHQIQKADVFVFYDDVQYDKRGWRNRNQIKTAAGLQWLTIPVLAKGHQTSGQTIMETPICWDADWIGKHWKAIAYAYANAPHYARYAERLAPFFQQRPQLLADFTIDLTIALARELGITGTQFVRSSTLGAQGAKTDRLLEICQAVGCTNYISGPSAQSYLDEDKMAAAGIGVEYMTYDYPEYPQLYPPFAPSVSIIDLLFMTGSEAANYIWNTV